LAEGIFACGHRDLRPENTIQSEDIPKPRVAVYPLRGLRSDIEAPVSSSRERVSASFSGEYGLATAADVHGSKLIAVTDFANMP